jgi:MFS family permease
VLLGSIFLYSAANIANGFVTNVPMYAALRFVAGIGLAGELGAGITLVSEAMPKELRAYGTVVVSIVGVLGAVVAAMVGDLFDWRIAYFVGGVMGIGLLLLRLNAGESGMFGAIKAQGVKRGSLILIFKSWPNVLKYLNCILIGIPLWFVIGILITFSPEFAKALGMTEMPTAGHAIMYTYIGISLGSLFSGVLSQWLASRKKATAIFMGLNGVFIALYLLNPHPSIGVFYVTCLLLGIASGYWALFVTIAAEQFGTNIRATAATTVPNFVRGAVVPVTLTFQYLKPAIGIIDSAAVIGFCCVALAFLALTGLEETHAKDLNYIE